MAALSCLPIDFYAGRFAPTLGLFAAPTGRTRELNDLWHFKSHFVFDDFAQRDIGHSEIRRVGDHWVARAAVAGIELAHTPRNHVYQDIRVPNFHKGLFHKFSVHILKSSGWWIVFTNLYHRRSLTAPAMREDSRMRFDSSFSLRNIDKANT
jgi:hypothetical protein